MFDILHIIPGRKKTSTSGWISFNGICCQHRGHKPDKRGRSGIKFTSDKNFTYHCFNCGFKATFILGKSISKSIRMLLTWCGIDEEEIARWNIESLQQKDLLDFTIPQTKIYRKVHFKETNSPKGELIDASNEKHHRFIEYLNSRCISYKDYPFMVAPDDMGRNRNRIIIPFTHNNKIVGHTSRFIDNRMPKFITEQQEGYLFGIDLQKPEWQVCIVVEGIFDALSINACALGHDDINEKQSLILKRMYNKKIIVVPDHDMTGIKICEKALDLGFHVSIPDWGTDVKDVNDAVIKYGRLPTVLSILQNATTSRIKIDMQRRKYDK